MWTEMCNVKDDNEYELFLFKPVMYINSLK